MIRIVVGGDIYPLGGIEKAFLDGNARAIFHDLLEDITGADLSIVNLESPLVTKNTPIAKPGGVLGASAKCINGFIASKWNVLNLANNHSYDHGAEGLRETINTIRAAGLHVIGAGLNIEEARTPFIKEIKGVKIILYSMAEHEYSVADDKVAGANPLDLINFVYTIRKHKQQGIFIVLIHGGKEFYPYPSPEMVRRCRFMVDMGADAVICCHTHCPLPWELYLGKPIVYGLGNLIFEPLRGVTGSWHEGYMAKLFIEHEQVKFEAVPYVQSKANSGAKKMDEAERNEFLKAMKKKASQIDDDRFLKELWSNYCMQHKDKYLMELFGYNRIMRLAGSVLLKLLHSEKEVMTALHLSQCETHREVLNTIFKSARQKLDIDVHGTQ